MQYGRLS